MDTNQPISEQYRLVGEDWADAHAAASLLEDGKSAFLAKLMSKHIDLPVNKREMIVKASDEWIQYLDKLSESKKSAAKLQIQKEYLKMKFYEWQTHEANKRQEMRM